MALFLTPITQDRWQVGVIVSLGKWLSYYLNSSAYAATWAKVGAGVEVWAPRPQAPPTAALSKPRLILRPAGEEQSARTVAEGADPLPGEPEHKANFNATYMRLTVEAECYTDDQTGEELSCYDLISAVRRIVELHETDLSAAGLLFIGASPGEITREEDTGLWLGLVTLTVEFCVLGEKVG